MAYSWDIQTCTSEFSLRWSIREREGVHQWDDYKRVKHHKQLVVVYNAQHAPPQYLTCCTGGTALLQNIGTLLDDEVGRQLTVHHWEGVELGKQGQLGIPKSVWASTHVHVYLVSCKCTIVCTRVHTHAHVYNVYLYVQWMNACA